MMSSSIKSAQAAIQQILTVFGTQAPSLPLEAALLAAPLAGPPPTSVPSFAPGQTWHGTDASEAHTGTALDDDLYGGGGDDTLSGGEGNDHMFGEGGVNVLNGGNGDDTYLIENSQDIVVEGDGNDKIFAAVDYTLAAGVAVEIMQAFGGEAISLTGNELSNKIHGNGAANILSGGGGADEIYGNAGNDVLLGGAGGDALYGDEGFDTVSYDDYVAADGLTGLIIDLNDPTRNTGFAAGDTYSSIEEFIGSRYNDTIVAGDGDISLDGNEGDDSIRSGNGGDRLWGDEGNDTLEGGLGGDTLKGGSGIDMAGYAHGAAGITVNLSDHSQNTGEAQGDTFDSIEGILGSDFGDRLIGNDGANILDGGKGNDILAGGKGNDVYVIDNDKDKILELDNEGYDTIVVSSNDPNFTFLSLYYFPNIETLQAGPGTFDFNLSGNDTGNKLIGNDGANFLNGGAGGDWMAGGKGNDDYVMDDVGDIVIEAAGAGYDAIKILSTSGIHAYVLPDNVEKITAESYSSGLKLKGNTLNNDISATTFFADTIDGGAGADRMAGHIGGDLYYVDNIRDRIVEVDNDYQSFAPGLSGNPYGYIDTVITTVNYGLSAYVENLTAAGRASVALTGNDLANVITGNGGNNTLNGKAGPDILKGGAGKDNFVFDTKPVAGIVDWITDYRVKSDTIYLDNAVFRKLGSGSLRRPGELDEDFFRMGSRAKDKKDHLIYNSKNGDLIYDSNGSSKGGETKIVQLSKGLKMTHDEFKIV